MIYLDRELIFRVRQLITGANVHGVNTLLFQYEQAVALHNAGHRRYSRYPAQYEMQLREFVQTIGRLRLSKLQPGQHA